MIDSPALEIGNSRDFGVIHEQVTRLVHEVAPEHDMTCIDAAFDLIEAGCLGRIPGYAALRTPFHDQGHVLEVVLCSVRLLHGLHLDGQVLDDLTIDACIIGALLHDSGYLMRDAEVQGTGAQFTQTHVARGVVFAETHLGHLLSPELLAATRKVILTTDHSANAVVPDYDNRSQQLAASVTATADLVGQMANREYLERLPLLYLEFKEAGIDFFDDIHDLMEKTDIFYQQMSARLQNELGGLAQHLMRHFEQARGVRRNYYLESVDRNLGFLASLVKEDRTRRLDRLKRGGIIERMDRSGET
jgi:hypothetical protein